MDYSTSRSPSPSSPAIIHRRSLVLELQKGHHAAQQYRRRLIRSQPSSPADDPTVSNFDLLDMIFKSFDNSLSIVRSCDASLVSRSSDDCKIEDPGCDGGGESSRIKDRRGCYKRRKRGQAWTTEGEGPSEDGHAWRKYGQKMILNSAYPRNYYRCTHKTDQGCQAIKQVQRTSEQPSRYKTTYNGHHTCKNPLKTPQIILPSSSPDQSDSSILLSFERFSNNNHPFFPPSNNFNSAIKQEQPPTTSAVNQAMMTTMMNQTSPSEFNYLSSSDPTTFSSGPHTGLPTTSGSDYGGDVISAGTYSCPESPHSLPVLDDIFLGQDHLQYIAFDCDTDN
uniref:WRKY transcription factor n=1 Tax=Fagopyrum tataricum TaxID=62330 RepID=A0A4P9Q2S7_FAGTA|nr:WRKY transcription factor [Fagopyrum tataricum]